MAGYAAYIAARGSAVLLADGTPAKAIKEERQEEGANGPVAQVRLHFPPAVEGRIHESDLVTHRSRPLRVRRLEFVEDGGHVVTIVAVCNPAD